MLVVAYTISIMKRRRSPSCHGLPQEDQDEGEVPMVHRAVKTRGQKIWMMLAPLITLLHSSAVLTFEKNIHNAEFFCGVRSVCNAFQYLNMEAMGLDVGEDPCRDLLLPSGCLVALYMVLRCKPGALSFWAPPCGSWVFLNRHTSGRSVDNPCGNIDLEYVALNNRLVARVVLLLRLAVALGVYWIVEQPVCSLLNIHPKLARAAKGLGLKRVFLWMKAFGGNRPKGTHLWGGAPYMTDLSRTMTKERLRSSKELQISVKYHDSKGQARVAGGKDLKGHSIISAGVWTGCCLNASGV